MPPREISVTLLERSCLLAFGESFDPGVVAKILTTPKDESLGSGRAVRHVMLTVGEARALLDQFQSAAVKFVTRGPVDNAKVCAEAVANIANALLVAGAK
jgi:hypothetical protein